MQDTLPPAFIDQVRAQFGGRDVIAQPVLSIEQTGDNILPLAGARVLAHGAGLRVSEHVVQSTRRQRTTLGGLGRIFSRPQFVGEVQAGASYLLLDDTLTQGCTLAALAAHIEHAGGHVVGMATLTGKNIQCKN